MKNTLALLSIFFLFVFIFSSCKKDDEPKQQTPTDILTAKAWKLEGVYLLGQRVDDLSQLGIPGDFSNSNVKFNADGTYVATERNTNATESGKWEFDSPTAPKKITLDKGTADEITFDIKTLTATNLDLSVTEQVNNFPITIDIKLIPA